MVRQFKAFFFFAFFPLLLLWPFFLQGKVIFWGIPIAQFYPWRSLAVALLGQGMLPLWNPHAGSGSPLLANHQTAPFYPLFVLYLLFPAEKALTFEVAFHLWLAGAFMYFCALGLGLRKEAAALAGLAYIGNGFLVSRLHFPTMVDATAWLPLVFLLTWRLCSRPRPEAAIALGVVIAVQFLAGHVQLWSYTLLLSALLVIWKSAIERKGIGLGGWFLASLALAILLAAVQFIPTAEFALNSGRKGGIPEELALTYSLWPWKILSFLMPDLFGNPARDGYWGYANYWEDCAYTGVLVFLLAALAFLRPQAKRVKAFFLCLIALSIALALGKNTPLFPFLYRHIPGLSFFRAPARFLLLFSFSMAVLAGFGAEAIGEKPLPPATLRRMGAGAAGLLVAALVLAFLPGIKPSFVRSAVTLAFASIGAVIALDLLPRRPYLSLLLLEAELLAYGWGFHPLIAPAIFHSPTQSSKAFGAQGELFRIYTFGPDDYHIKYDLFFRFDRFGPPTLDYWMKLRESLIPQTNMIARTIDHAGVFDPLTIGRYEEFLALVDRLPREQALKLLGLLNVRYIVEPASPEGAEFRFRENPYFLPRVRLAYRAVSVPEGEELEALSSPAFDPEVVLLSGAPASDFPRGANDSILDLHYGPGVVKIKCALENGGYLVLSENYYPGWRVEVDGKPAPLLRAYYTLMAVRLGAGEHQVAFKFSPASFKIGLALSLATLAFVTAFMAWRERWL